MTAYAAFLRAVNLGAASTLPMVELKRLCGEAGFRRATTYIASGNVVFEADDAEAAVKRRLEATLAAFAGFPIPVMVRTADELAAVVAGNPFPEADGSRCVAVFLDAPPPADALEAMRGQADEVPALGRREIYIHYPSGQGRSKLRIPAAQNGTARNMNTVAKVAAMTGAL